jgi:hypothetical protein
VTEELAGAVLETEPATAPQIDPEFAKLIPPLAADELAKLEADLLAQRGCREALVAWKGHNVLLDGHNRLRLCRQHGLTDYRVVEVELPDREAAKQWIIHNQMGRRNLTAEAASYLRGRRYLLEKQAHGGDRKSAEARGQVAPLKTADRLAAEYKVDPRTIKRDALFAQAVDLLSKHCGEDVKPLVLARDARLPRRAALQLAKLDRAEQQRVVKQLRDEGKLPRPLLPRPEGKRMVSLPADPKEWAQAVLERLGAKKAAALHRALAAALEKAAPDEGPKPRKRGRPRKPR